MGKKRKSPGQQQAQTGPKGLDPSDARLGPINTFEDVADSEDEFWMKREVISLNDEPKSKRRKQWEHQDKVLEDSEEELLADDDSDDDSDDNASDLERLQASLKFKTKGRTLDADEEAPVDNDDGDGRDQGWRGAMRDEFYNADTIETEEAAIEEETEALRLQQKKLAKMSEADFVFDQDEWATPMDDAPDKKVVTEVLKDVEVSDNMSPEERYQVLRNRYPEFHFLVTEFELLQPKLVVLQKESEGKPSKSLEVVRYWTLGCYVAALASYFAILTSPARDEIGVDKTMDPEELRDHEVMETLVNCQEQWTRVNKLRLTRKPQPKASTAPPLVKDTSMLEREEIPERPRRKRTAKKQAAVAKDKQEAAQKKKQAKVVQDSIADLSSLLQRPKKAKKAVPSEVPAAQDNSDFGEEEAMDSRYAAEKAARKKSLRFYTSQIVQKSNKRAGAGKNVGGDMDIPYRERLRDRQARLVAEAQKRGSKAGPGADLDENSSDDDDRKAAKDVRDDDSDDEYYGMVAGAAQKKKTEKAAKFEAYAAATKRDLVVEQEEVGADGKRKISYAIQKNKGLTPHRNKLNRNPRVKKRKAYAEKQKKWKTVRPTFQGAPQGGYQGELSGIKKGLVKVTKL